MIPEETITYANGKVSLRCDYLSSEDMRIWLSIGHASLQAEVDDLVKLHEILTCFLEEEEVQDV